MHTVEEAKTKWCPMLRVISAGKHGFVFNRKHADVIEGNCCSDQCMWWVWTDCVANKNDPVKGRCGMVKA